MASGLCRDVRARTGSFSAQFSKRWGHRNPKRRSASRGPDALIRVASCADQIILTYPDDPSISQPKPTLKRDRALLQFRKYFNAEKLTQPNELCIGCWKYSVTCEFEGRLDVTESAGWRREADTGKVIGFVGFGHPAPFSRYRLILSSVSKVEVRKL